MEWNYRMRICDDCGIEEASAYCSLCGKDLCEDCVKYLDGCHYCEDCLKGDK